MNTAEQTALETVEAMAPAIAAADPKLAPIIALAPIALTFLQSAMQLQQAGVLGPAALVAMFKGVGQGVQTEHDKWAAMNAADAAK